MIAQKYAQISQPTPLEHHLLEMNPPTDVGEFLLQNPTVKSGAIDCIKMLTAVKTKGSISTALTDDEGRSILIISVNSFDTPQSELDELIAPIADHVSIREKLGNQGIVVWYGKEWFQ